MCQGARFMMECMSQSCLNQTRFWSSCLTTDSIFSCSEPKNNCASVMTRRTMISVLTKTWPHWITRFSENLNPNICGATKIIWQILRWYIFFRIKFLWRRNELLAAKVLHIFPQIPPYKSFWTTWICHTLPLCNQQLPPSPGRKLQYYYLQLLSKGATLPPLTPIKKPLLPQLLYTGGPLLPFTPNKTLPLHRSNYNARVFKCLIYQL